MEETNDISLKKRIIDAARQVLLSEGYRNFSLRKIARQVDASATSIYLHFENKDDLVHTLMEEAIERLNTRKASRKMIPLKSWRLWLMSMLFLL